MEEIISWDLDRICEIGIEIYGPMKVAMCYWDPDINLWKTKCRLLYLKTQFVPHINLLVMDFFSNFSTLCI